MWIKYWGDLITNGWFEKISCASLAATWHRANYKSSRPRGAGDDTTANNLNCSSGQTLAEETGPNCGANGTEWFHVWSQGESAACKRGWINHVITERQHGSRRRFLLRAAAKVKNRTTPIQKFLNRLNCYCSSFCTIISNKRQNWWQYTKRCLINNFPPFLFLYSRRILKMGKNKNGKRNDQRVIDQTSHVVAYRAQSYTRGLW